MRKFDLHVHSNYSPCSNLSCSNILKLYKKKGYDGIALTDHNTLKGYNAIKRLNRDKDFEIIKSCEYKTSFGDVLAYDIQEPIRKLEFFEFCDKAKEQDALLVLAHPFRAFKMQSFKGRLKEVKPLVQGIEVLNGRTDTFSNKKARKAADKFGFSRTGGSDAHTTFECGAVANYFRGDFRTAFLKNKLIIKRNIKNPTYPLASIYSGYLLMNSFFKKHIRKKCSKSKCGR